MSDRRYTPVSPAQSNLSPKDELAERKPRRKQASEGDRPHEHIFVIATSESIVVRCCQMCGMTHYLERPRHSTQVAYWEHTWQVVAEPEQED